MCGIAGVFRREGPVPAALLDAMTVSLRHRGPDADSTWRSDTVGFAHTRLSIIDVAGGGQPLFDRARSLCLIANGEIYNHVELRAELERRGHEFLTHSDCETILHAYAAYGDDFLGHLRGMFACALFDLRQRRLLLARDRLGIKPLYVSEQREGVYFASELKALLPHLDASTVNPAALVQYLNHNFTSGRETAVLGVERVQPGEWLVIEGGRIVRRARYWTLTEAAQAEPRGDPARAAARFDEILDTLVPQHLRTDVPFGAFLSGGVDSSVIAALLARHAKEPLRTYSVGFPESTVANELPAAARIARHLETVHAELALTREDLLRVLPVCVHAADDLMGDYASLATARLAQRAGRDLKVVFTGEGGDEVFAGYGRYRMPRLRRWLRALRRPGSGGFRTAGLLPGGWESRLYGPELLAARDAWREPIVAAWREAPRSWSSLQRMQYVDLMTWLPDDLLVKTDRMLMAYGVEGRVPYLDHELVAFGLALPDALKIEGRHGKAFLKRWAERMLPRESLWTRKRGFTAPVRDWMQGAWLGRLERVLPAHDAVRTWLRPDGVAALCRQHRAQGGTEQLLWALLQFCLWHTLFFGPGAGAGPPPEADPLDLLES